MAANRLIYNVNFLDGSLNPGEDMLHMGPLHFGHSEPPNPLPRYSCVDGELFLSVILPAIQDVGSPPPAVIRPPPPPPTVPGVTAGVFATPVRFDSEVAPFELRGTYIAPSGPLDKTWAVGILARNGGVDDLSTNTQVVATLQFRPGPTGPSARLNVPLGRVRRVSRTLPGSVCEAILPTQNPNRNPVPFTLALEIRREYGVGNAHLIVEGLTYSAPFQLKDFTPKSGPPISAVGTVISNLTATNEAVSVRVQDFQIRANI